MEQQDQRKEYKGGSSAQRLVHKAHDKAHDKALEQKLELTYSASVIYDI